MEYNDQMNNQPAGEAVAPSEYEEYDEEPVQEVIDVWDEDEFGPRGEDYLPVSVALSISEESSEAVTLMIEAVDANFSVRMHKEELKEIAKRLVDACKEL